MKKLLFCGSSSSKNNGTAGSPAPLPRLQVCCDNPVESEINAQQIHKLERSGFSASARSVIGEQHQERSRRRKSSSRITLAKLMKEDVDLELLWKLKAVEEIEPKQENSLEDAEFGVPILIQTIKNLRKDKVSLAMKVSSLVKSIIADRKSANKQFRVAKSLSDSNTQRLEKEKNESQSALEKELDRKSRDWSMKLQEYQFEELRLREQVRKLAEHTVSLQGEVSSLTEMEIGNRNDISNSEQQIGETTARVSEESNETQNLRQSLDGLQEKYTENIEDFNRHKKIYEEKDQECKDFKKVVTKLSRARSKQEKLIEGFREEFTGRFEMQQSIDLSSKHIGNLQMEQMRLMEVELAIRKEIDNQRLEMDSLRQENMMLSNCLKGNEKELDALNFKLDKETLIHTRCLQNQVLSLLNESTRLCLKLLEHAKAKHYLDLQVNKNASDGQFLIEPSGKIQEFKHETECSTQSLQKISSLLPEKSNTPVALGLTDNVESGKLYNHILEDDLRFELKMETLMTSLLKEKLQMKEIEVEQLQAELSAAVRSNDVLRCEVHNVLNGLCFANHKLKDCELKMLMKDELTIRLQNELEETAKELSVMKGMVDRVKEERDFMKEEAKQYKEKKILMESEVEKLKKTIEDVEEDILLKEGQITILKDTINSSSRNRSCNLLDGADWTDRF